MKEVANILIIGDSISMGYTPFVKKILQERAKIFRPHTNCESTQKGVLKIDQWVGDKKYKVIHFNFGLHDLKHVDAVTKQPSVKPEDPIMTDLKDYEANLNTIVSKLKATGAKLIFATTTPVPQHSEPLREPENPEKYNVVAQKVMQEQGIEVNDLYHLVMPDFEKIQELDNVHFTRKGYRILGEQVAAVISKYT